MEKKLKYFITNVVNYHYNVKKGYFDRALDKDCKIDTLEEALRIQKELRKKGVSKCVVNWE